MSPTNRMVRKPTATAALFALSNLISVATASPFSFPQPTRTVEYHELNVQPWPLATAGPELELFRRQLNTVCGYIGGNPDLPATCSAGSHCVVDADQGVIGCCPDGGSCTQGVFTGCVDSDSDAQTEVNPYVFTCSGAERCYMNEFEGGYSQFGCGTATNLATTVAVTASGKSAISLSTLSGPSQTNSESTRSTRSTASKTDSTETSSETSTKTKTKTSTETTTSDTSETETATNTETDSSSATASNDSSSTSSASAPDADGKDNGSKNTGAIIGGTISGVAALAALIALGIWLWKRKKSNRDVTEIRAGPDSNGNIQPLLPPQMRQVDSNQAPPPMPMPVARGGINMVDDRGYDRSFDRGLDEAPEPYSSQTNAYAFAPGTGIGVAVGGDPHMDLDEVPLTRDNRDIDEFTQVYNNALGPIDEEDSRPTTGPVTPMGSYPGPRGGSGGPLWQQNRGPSWV